MVDLMKRKIHKFPLWPLCISGLSLFYIIVGSLVIILIYFNQGFSTDSGRIVAFCITWGVYFLFGGIFTFITLLYSIIYLIKSNRIYKYNWLTLVFSLGYFFTYFLLELFVYIINRIKIQ